MPTQEGLLLSLKTMKLKILLDFGYFGYNGTKHPFFSPFLRMGFFMVRNRVNDEVKTIIFNRHR